MSGVSELLWWHRSLRHCGDHLRAGVFDFCSLSVILPTRLTLLLGTLWMPLVFFLWFLWVFVCLGCVFVSSLRVPSLPRQFPNIGFLGSRLPLSSRCAQHRSKKKKPVLITLSPAPLSPLPFLPFLLRESKAIQIQSDLFIPLALRRLLPWNDPKWSALSKFAEEH